MRVSGFGQLLCGKAAGEADVLLSVGVIGSGRFFPQGAHDLSRHSQHHAAGGDYGPLGHNCPRAYHRSSADDRAIQYNRTHADEAVILHRAGVEDGAVPHGDELSHVAAAAYVDVQAGVVLYIAAAADDDRCKICAEGGVVPDGGIGL